jgi:uncharacterized protein
LPLAEPEREGLRTELGRWEGHVSSVLLAVEAGRACARFGADYAEQAQAGLAGVALLPVDAAVLEAAARLQPLPLRSLDALHLATALSLGEDLGVLIAYDERLLDAAARHGIPTANPH